MNTVGVPACLAHPVRHIPFSLRHLCRGVPTLMPGRDVHFYNQQQTPAGILHLRHAPAEGRAEPRTATVPWARSFHARVGTRQNLRPQVRLRDFNAANGGRGGTYSKGK